MQEIWEDINGYEGLYQVSNLGRVKSLGRTIVFTRNNREIKSKLKECILRAGLSKGYCYVVLNGSSKTVHRLVAQAFIPNPENKETVNHINGDKADNRVENLEWATQLENNNHAFKNGLNVGKKGEKNGRSKITKKQVLDIINRLKSGESQKYIAKLYNIGQSQVSRINRGESWTHLFR